MRRVTYYINDIEWFRNDLTHHNPELTIAQIEDILGNMSPAFMAEYSLIGDTQPDRYELSVANNNGGFDKCSINAPRLNGYHHMILNDCWRHYMGREHTGTDILVGYPKEDVFGCIEIIETEEKES